MGCQEVLFSCILSLTFFKIPHTYTAVALSVALCRRKSFRSNFQWVTELRAMVGQLFVGTLLTVREPPYQSLSPQHVRLCRFSLYHIRQRHGNLSKASDYCLLGKETTACGRKSYQGCEAKCYGALHLAELLQVCPEGGKGISHSFLFQKKD